MSTPVAPRLTERTVGPISRTDFVRFAGAGGDFNPVHHDDEYARAHGFPQVFAMGMFTAGLLGRFVSDAFGIQAVERLSVRFLAPAWPGDMLRFSLSGDAPYMVTVIADEGVRASGVVALRGEETAEPDVDAPDDPLVEGRLAEIAQHELADVVLPVERGKVVEFARAVGSDSPLHVDEAAAAAAGYPGLVAPLVFSCVVAHWNGGDGAALATELGLELSRVVHGEQRWIHHRPLVAGDELTGRRAVAGVRTKGQPGAQMTLVTVATDFHDAQGHAVLREEMVIVELPAQRAQAA